MFPEMRVAWDSKMLKPGIRLPLQSIYGSCYQKGGGGDVNVVSMGEVLPPDGNKVLGKKGTK